MKHAEKALFAILLGCAMITQSGCIIGISHANPVLAIAGGVTAWENLNTFMCMAFHSNHEGTILCYFGMPEVWIQHKVYPGMCVDDTVTARIAGFSVLGLGIAGAVLDSRDPGALQVLNGIPNTPENARKFGVAQHGEDDYSLETYNIDDRPAIVDLHQEISRIVAHMQANKGYTKTEIDQGVKILGLKDGNELISIVSDTRISRDTIAKIAAHRGVRPEAVAIYARGWLNARIAE
jgi:hypothetical protein